MKLSGFLKRLRPPGFFGRFRQPAKGTEGKPIMENPNRKPSYYGYGYNPAAAATMLKYISSDHSHEAHVLVASDTIGRLFKHAKRAKPVDLDAERKPARDMEKKSRLNNVLISSMSSKRTLNLVVVGRHRDGSALYRYDVAGPRVRSPHPPKEVATHYFVVNRQEKSISDYYAPFGAEDVVSLYREHGGGLGFDRAFWQAVDEREKITGKYSFASISSFHPEAGNVMYMQSRNLRIGRKEGGGDSVFSVATVSRMPEVSKEETRRTPSIEHTITLVRELPKEAKHSAVSKQHQGLKRLG
jgi:hypothetical protein